MDHIQGLGFFRPLFQADVEVHLWGPVATTPLTSRLARYLSPPLFPVRLRELPSLVVEEMQPGTVEIGPFTVTAEFVIHPGQTYGYRIECDGRSLAYIPDHEPALGVGEIPANPEWTSGYALARNVDLLLHDTQYTDPEYPDHVGWGHSTITQALRFAELCEVGRLVSFHHEPNHTDEEIDAHHTHVFQESEFSVGFEPGLVGSTFEV
jgi:phosphoribosyl 1,2-cyclic phosphodiesterase